jgi:hypothetical protein
MRSPGAVYKKLKEAKYFHFVNLFKKFMKRIPSNCKFNYSYKLINEGGTEREIRLCLLHQPGLDLKKGITPHLVDVCEETRHVGNCNGFIPKYTKEEIKKIFEEELCSKNIKEKKYSDICALEWVLERSVVGIPPFTWVQRFFYIIKKLITKNKIL